MNNFQIDKSSFRDPSGFLFHQNGTLFRQVNKSYKDDYDQLMDSGLYQTLIKKNLLIPYEEINLLRISCK